MSLSFTPEYENHSLTAGPGGFDEASVIRDSQAYDRALARWGAASPALPKQEFVQIGPDYMAQRDRLIEAEWRCVWDCECRRKIKRLVHRFTQQYPLLFRSCLA